MNFLKGSIMAMYFLDTSVICSHIVNSLPIRKYKTNSESFCEVTDHHFSVDQESKIEEWLQIRGDCGDPGCWDRRRTFSMGKRGGGAGVSVNAKC